MTCEAAKEATLSDRRQTWYKGCEPASKTLQKGVTYRQYTRQCVCDDAVALRSLLLGLAMPDCTPNLETGRLLNLLV